MAEPMKITAVLGKEWYFLIKALQCCHPRLTDYTKYLNIRCDRMKHTNSPPVFALSSPQFTGLFSFNLKKNIDCPCFQSPASSYLCFHRLHPSREVKPPPELSLISGGLNYGCLLAPPRTNRTRQGSTKMDEFIYQASCFANAAWPSARQPT